MWSVLLVAAAVGGANGQVTLCGTTYPPGTTIITMSAVGCAGTIPDFSSMTSLTSLQLHDNQLTGTIPDLTSLISLGRLYLNSNQLTGTIPDLTSLTLLSSLLLYDNQLTGTIPDLTSLTSLVQLLTYDNQLTGTIPDLTSLTSLVQLYLGGNDWLCPLTDYSFVPSNDFSAATCTDPSVFPTAAPTVSPTAAPTTSPTAKPTSFPVLDNLRFTGTVAFQGATGSLTECNTACDIRPLCQAATYWQSGWCAAWSQVTDVLYATNAVSWIAPGVAHCAADDANALSVAFPGMKFTRPCGAGTTGDRTLECKADSEWQEDVSGCVYDCECRTDIMAVQSIIQSEFAALRAQLGLV